MHCVADRGLADAKKQLTDSVLTIGAYGFENVQAKIEESIRKAAGRGVVTTEAACEAPAMPCSRIKLSGGAKGTRTPQRNALTCGNAPLWYVKRRRSTRNDLRKRETC